MKKYFLILYSILFLLFSFNKTSAQQVVLNGTNTSPINFPTGSCVYTWVNDNTSIGLAANGTGDIPSFTAVNTGSSPVTATITGTPTGSPGFAYIVNADSNDVSVIDLATGTVVATIPVGSNPNSVCVDPNYNEVYVVNNSSNTVSVINTLTNMVTATIPVGPTPWSVTVSPDGSMVYLADGGDNDVEVINTTTNTVVATIPAGTNPNALAVSPDGSLIYVNNSNSVTVINTSTHAVVATIPVGSAPQAILITPDGSKVYEANYGSNDVYVINTATNMVSGIIPVGTNPGGGSMSPDGSVVYIANEGSSSVSVISTATNTVIKTIPVGGSPWGVSVRPDGTQIYVANSGSNTVSVVNSSTNAIISTIPVGSSPYSFGSFFTAGMNCSALVKFTITVNPTSVLPSIITATAATGAISACMGTASASPNIQQFTVSGSNLTGSITATAPAGFEISLAAGSGYGSSVIIAQASGTVINTVVYVRSAASLPGGTTTDNVLLSSPGAAGQTVSVTGLIDPVVTASLVISASGNNSCAGTPITFTAAPTNGGSTPVYQWVLNGSAAGTNSPTFSDTFANGDVVSCTMTGGLACTTPANIISNSIIVNIFPLPVVNAGGDKTVEKGSTVVLTATASGNIADITWSPATGLDNNKILNPQASPASTTLYTITVETADGCTAMDTATVTVFGGVSIPNTFTPNGDGVNDKWDIQNLDDYPNCVVRIFDRWGSEVYNSKGYYTAWDGTIKGRRLPVGTYYYLINLNNGARPLSGFVALIR